MPPRPIEGHPVIHPAVGLRRGAEVIVEVESIALPHRRRVQQGKVPTESPPVRVGPDHEFLHQEDGRLLCTMQADHLRNPDRLRVSKDLEACPFLLKDRKRTELGDEATPCLRLDTTDLADAPT